LVCFTAGVWGEPTAYRFDAAQLRDHWLGAVEPLDAGVTLLAGEAATAGGLRSILQILAAGGGAVLADRWVPARVVRRLRQGGLDRLSASGPQLNQLAGRLEQASGRPLPGLRRVDAHGGLLHGAAALRYGRLLDAAVLTTYTLTEAGGPATCGVARPASHHRPLDVGRPARGLGLDVLGADGAPLPCGVVGEVHVGGPATGRGGPPSGRIGATGGPGRATGDRGRLDAQGHLHLIGRAADRFTCDGVEVWPQLVELALSAHPLVADIAVAPRPDPSHGMVGVAVVVPTREDHPPFLADLAPLLAELPPAWRPRAQVVADRLPLTATGQVHRRMLTYEESAR
jgi:acyl-coenzyme A synthetase/AMP-(fatty) acid ligase